LNFIFFTRVILFFRKITKKGHYHYINKSKKGYTMLKKMTPLIVLALFAIGAYFMVKGMDNAVKLSKPQTAAKK